MFKHGFPPYWSTLKKLVWIVGTGIVGGVTEIWKTVTGTLIHITDALASPMQKCEVTLEPIQDLHGQDAPYPAGGGKNKLPYPFETVSGTSRNNITYTESGGAISISNSGQASVVTTFNLATNLLLKAGTYTASISSDIQNTQIIFRDFNGGTNVAILKHLVLSQTFTINSDTQINIYISIAKNNQPSATNVFVQLEEGTTATPWSPFANICPITGWTGCEVWVKDEYDTSLPATASVTFPDGQTVYGGTVDLVSGVLTVTDDEIASYNGETLPSTWISDRDVYAVGTTPTIGAQVVYKLATPTEIQLTPQEISTLKDENNVWSDANGDIILIYKAQAE